MGYGQYSHVNQSAEENSILWYFGKPEIEVSTKIHRIDLYNFVSAVGGGLGLFLGFSVLSTLDVVSDILTSLMLKKHSKSS